MSLSERKIQVNSILYGNEPLDIERTVDCLDRAADLAIADGLAGSVTLAYGDCSPKPVIDQLTLDRMRNNSKALAGIEYIWFDENLGSAAGHNRLLSKTESDFVLIMNPDVRLAPDCLTELIRAMSDESVGMVEAKQLPIEHPKAFKKNGETSWAATACALFPTELISKLDGFDSESFFLYCDDVDISWRTRLEGKKVIYMPSAVVFHDKRLGKGGGWDIGDAERYYSAEAALLLAYKYSREDVLAHIVADFKVAKDPVFARALAEFERRKELGLLPEQLDKDRKVGEFVDGAYAIHRFQL